MADDLLPGAVLAPRDAQVADDLLEAWLDGLEPEVQTVLREVVPRAVLALRGMLTTAAADLRAAGIAEGFRAGQLEGLQQGREEWQHLYAALLSARDALQAALEDT